MGRRKVQVDDDALGKELARMPETAKALEALRRQVADLAGLVDLVMTERRNGYVCLTQTIDEVFAGVLTRARKAKARRPARVTPFRPLP